MSQSVKPDVVVLWVAHEDEHQLPDNVVRLQELGQLQIRTTTDIRSFKKIIPSLQEWPDAFIVTADDDVHYPATWLADLLETYRASKQKIVCHRAREAALNDKGDLAPYSAWPVPTKPASDAIIFPTGMGGVLYSPGSLHPEVLNQSAFLSYCPHGDDIWLGWMGRLAGSGYAVCRYRSAFIIWSGSQDVALWRENVTRGENDVQISNMVSAYGNLVAPTI